VCDKKMLRLFGADCAERVLPIFLKVLPNDDRPAKAIQAARDYANGKIDATAGSAAWSAAQAAALDAAGDAAGAAAGAAAWSAAGAAAGYAAGYAERQWQGEHLVDMIRSGQGREVSR
jgi:hypothetical protein